jgi:hypothetical protein
MAKRSGHVPGRHIRPLNLAIQGLRVLQKFPGFSYKITNGTVTITGQLQPRFTSPLFSVKIVYKLKDIPKVWVVSPQLHPGAVHLYADKHLCLYWPKEWTWTSDQSIADTIIPWTGSWLFYYELWLDTGKWLGPSSHDYHP